MISKRDITESRLYDALNRLLEGKPIRVKGTGKITLNMINNEAGLGRSYVHKFSDFLVYAKPIINEHNKQRELILENESILSDVVFSKKEQFNLEILRLEKLKRKYREERNDAIAAHKIVMKENAALSYRIHSLQTELQLLKQNVPNK